MLFDVRKIHSNNMKIRTTTLLPISALLIAVSSILATQEVIAQKPEEVIVRGLLKEEGENLEHVKQFNSAIKFRFTNQNKKLLDLAGNSFKKPDFKAWIDSQPDGVQKQLACAMQGALDGKPLKEDILVADLRDFVDPTGVKWKLLNGGAMTYFKTTGERGQIVRVDIHRRNSASGELVDIDSYAYEGSAVPDPKLLRRCLEENKDYMNSRWILEEYKTDEGKIKFRLFLRGSIPAVSDPKLVRSLMGNLALSADAIEQEYSKEDEL